MTIDPHLFVVFGATGDLMKRKLLPALYDLTQHLPSDCRCLVLGTSRSDLSDEAYRDVARDALVEHGLDRKKAKPWCAGNVFFQPIGDGTAKDFSALSDRIEALEKEHDLPGNRVFYFALPPQAFEPTLAGLGKAGLADSKGWTRLVIEKPFGHDLASAQALNALIHQHFDEDQVYRIDHYLGKETVQNLMVFRFGNAIFETLWNRDHVEHVDVLVAEDLGVGTRAGYYDRAGALRDMVQNHLTQLLTLVAMEPPATASANAIRREKIKVLQSVRPLAPDDVLFGQYTRGVVDGEPVPGYREATDVASDSMTATYVAVPLEISNWRWQGVPFILRTGKRLPHRLTEITVTFRHPPIALFQTFNGCRFNPNVLRITLQPDEGFALGFEVKAPGEGMRARTQQLRFEYEEAFGKLPDAYRTLLEDVVRGDQTLFVHAEEVEAAWQLYTPLLDAKAPLRFYSAGTWGPPEAEQFLPQP